jgi:hypothetical protein
MNGETCSQIEKNGWRKEGRSRPCTAQVARWQKKGTGKRPEGMNEMHCKKRRGKYEGEWRRLNHRRVKCASNYAQYFTGTRPVSAYLLFAEVELRDKRKAP